MFDVVEGKVLPPTTALRLVVYLSPQSTGNLNPRNSAILQAVRILYNECSTVAEVSFYFIDL